MYDYQTYSPWIAEQCGRSSRERGLSMPRARAMLVQDDQRQKCGRPCRCCLQISSEHGTAQSCKEHDLLFAVRWPGEHDRAETGTEWVVRGSNLCCRPRAVTTAITASTSVVITAALDSL